MTGWHATTRLPRDHYLRLDANDYSVHPAAVGRRVEIVADLEQVVATCAGAEVARHQRCWARHQSLTDPAHATAAAALRQARQHPVPAPVDTEVAHRSLADYDRVFGLTDDLTDDPAQDLTGDPAAEPTDNPAGKVSA